MPFNGIPVSRKNLIPVAAAAPAAPAAEKELAQTAAPAPAATTAAPVLAVKFEIKHALAAATVLAFAPLKSETTHIGSPNASIRTAMPSHYHDMRFRLTCNAHLMPPRVRICATEHKNGEGAYY